MKDNECMTTEGQETNGGEGAVEEAHEIIETPEEETKRLSGELASRTKEAADNHERFLRACADLDNYKKRAEKEKADGINFANESLISEVLPVLDNFERAFSHAREENLDSLTRGVHLIIEQMCAVLKKFGLEEIKSVGERFDPAAHHAISHEDSAQAEPETVVREFQKGYYLKGRLLRPAMVSVAKAPETGGPR
ncbi:MAG: nucleotide exchange factor GrpE [Deltaproteobacteria bacterium]|nr:nucleotide exchange factor GrpE [Deltaproteobacteria bacterium]